MPQKWRFIVLWPNSQAAAGQCNQRYSKIPGAGRRLPPHDTPVLHGSSFARQSHVNTEPRLVVDAG
jgi:hypothetical protein